MYIEVAKELRVQVNSDSMFFNSKVNDENKWDIICSCMDWLDKASIHLDNSSLESNSEFNDIISYIACVDIFLESYLQLYRAIMNKEYKCNIYSNSNNMFKNSVYVNYNGTKNLISELHQNNDYDSFKHIRAVLGFHPTNLKIGEKRYFAGYNGLIEKCIEGTLWSKEDNKHIKINLLDIQIFLDDIKGKIEDLINKIPDIVKKHIKNYKEKSIQESEDVFEQIKILEKEANLRVPGESLEENLMIYKLILNNKDSNIKMKEFKKFIVDKINLLEKELQEMDVKSEYSIGISSCSKEKISTWVYAKIYHTSLNLEENYDMVRSELNSILKGNVSLPETIDSKDDIVNIWSILYYEFDYLSK